jgi:hypothetical protein
VTTRKAGHPDMAVDILEYFIRNPDATDDLEGIARFRLLDQIIYRHVGEVSSALNWLVAAGLLTRTDVAEGHALYSLNRTRRAEAERFLAQCKSNGPPDDNAQNE